MNRISVATAFIFSLLFVANAFSEAPLVEPGAMVREGNWSDGVGTFLIPSAFSNIDREKWPSDGWSKLTIGPKYIQSERVIAPKGQIPIFLRSIASQADSILDESQVAVQATEMTNEKNELYLRVPRAKIRQGDIPLLLFKNGTSSIRPILDKRYDLVLANKPFSLTVQNGFRSKTGATYGEGAQYKIEYDGHAYFYDLGGYGWDSMITGVTDLDGDGKPDFIISIGGSNSGTEAVLLSSKAKPGKNPATASLSSIGC